jgi:pyridoxine 4-dehydrogenase
VAQAGAPVVAVQNKYALDTAREHDGFVRDCGQRGIAFVPFFALTGAGRHRGGVAGGSAAVQAVARAHDATPAQVRLAWTLHQGPHVLAIPGTGDPDHVDANVAAGRLQLSSADLTALDAVDPATH